MSQVFLQAQSIESAKLRTSVATIQSQTLCTRMSSSKLLHEVVTQRSLMSNRPRSC